jgi:hypothetical protein
MSHDNAAPLVVEMVKGLVSILGVSDPCWQKGYLRILLLEDRSRVEGSYTHGSSVDLIEAMQYGDSMQEIAKLGRQLLEALGKGEGLILLEVDSGLQYEIRFEYEDMERWRVDKADGNTGIPLI